jgi:hypothetical protein
LILIDDASNVPTHGAEIAILNGAETVYHPPNGKVDPDAIKDIAVDATYMGGDRVWQAPANAVARTIHFPDTFYSMETATNWRTWRKTAEKLSI